MFYLLFSSMQRVCMHVKRLGSESIRRGFQSYYQVGVRCVSLSVINIAFLLPLMLVIPLLDSILFLSLLCF